MPSVKISGECEQMLIREQDRLEDEHGIRGTKKELAEQAITEMYSDE